MWPCGSGHPAMAGDRNTSGGCNDDRYSISIVYLYIYIYLKIIDCRFQIL